MTKFPSLYRPAQLAQNQGDLKRLERVSSDPFLMRGVTDKGGLHKQIRALKASLAEYTPTPFAASNRDDMAKRAEQLKNEFTAGMPTAAEMRKSPPGSVGKHMAWEQRNKAKILEWKYISRRLEPENEDPDLTNIEKFRKHGGVDELSMDNAFIPGKTIILPAATPEPGAVANDTELEVLRALDPELAEGFAVLTGEQRVQVLDLVRQHMANVVSKKPEKAKRAKRVLTPEQRAELGRRLAEGRAKKQAEREAAQQAA